MADTTLTSAYDGDMPSDHGVSGYRSGCRCDICTEAHTEAMREWKETRAGLAPDDPRHCSDNGYRNHKCRCDCCRAAGTAATRAQRQRKANA